MAQKKRKQLKAWSYSTYNMWTLCPQRIFFSKIEKLPDPMGRAAFRGIKVHNVAEKYVKGELNEIQTRGDEKILLPFKPDLDLLREDPTVRTEADFTFTRDWEQTRWNDWDYAWVRMKLDVLYKPESQLFVLIDYKTGMMRDYEKQTELYATGCFTAHEDAEVVRTELWHLDHPEDEDAILGYTYTRDEADKLRETWEARVRPMMEDTVYRPTPGQHCSWCPYHQKKGGPCRNGR